MARTNRKYAILAILRSGPVSVYSLASRLDAPEASIRRSIQELRADGYGITDARDNIGLYRLDVQRDHSTPVANAATV
jgi:biotin operon repressor